VEKVVVEEGIHAGEPKMMSRQRETYEEHFDEISGELVLQSMDT
jgi:hypothetical protein